MSAAPLDLVWRLGRAGLGTWYHNDRLLGAAFDPDLDLEPVLAECGGEQEFGGESRGSEKLLHSENAQGAEAGHENPRSKHAESDGADRADGGR